MEGLWRESTRKLPYLILGLNHPARKQRQQREEFVPCFQRTWGRNQSVNCWQNEIRLLCFGPHPELLTKQYINNGFLKLLSKASDKLGLWKTLSCLTWTCSAHNLVIKDGFVFSLWSVHFSSWDSSFFLRNGFDRLLIITSFFREKAKQNFGSRSVSNTCCLSARKKI